MFVWRDGDQILVVIRKPLRTSLRVRKMKMFEGGDTEMNNNKELLVD